MDYEGKNVKVCGNCYRLWKEMVDSKERKEK